MSFVSPSALPEISVFAQEEKKMDTDKIHAESIAKEYAKKDDSKVIALKKLDRKAKLLATVFAYNFGSLCALIFGTGMCFSMEAFGGLGMVWKIFGIVIGAIGIALMGFNGLIYRRMLAKGKEKCAFDIIPLPMKSPAMDKR